MLVLVLPQLPRPPLPQREQQAVPLMVVSMAVTILILKSTTVALGDSEELGLQPAPRPVE